MPRQNFLATAEDDLPQGSALKTLEVTVLESWIDYNGHMTEWQYYRLLADAGEVLLRAIGFSEEYRLKGYSFFNVQGQQRNLRNAEKTLRSWCSRKSSGLIIQGCICINTSSTPIEI